MPQFPMEIVFHFRAQGSWHANGAVPHNAAIYSLLLEQSISYKTLKRLAIYSNENGTDSNSVEHFPPEMLLNRRN